MLSNKIFSQICSACCSNIKAPRLLNPVPVKWFCGYTEAKKAAEVLHTHIIRRVYSVEFKLERNYMRLTMNKFKNE